MLIRLIDETQDQQAGVDSAAARAEIAAAWDRFGAALEIYQAACADVNASEGAQRKLMFAALSARTVVQDAHRRAGLEINWGDFSDLADCLEFRFPGPPRSPRSAGKS